LPVLLLSVALAASIKASGAETLVARVFGGHPVKAVLAAALAGSLSPLCSCGVVPLIAGLLASGVPLAPVMAFWLASPVMDPAMFVLTAGAIGLEFALVKTLAAIGIGVFGGAVAMQLEHRGWFVGTLREHRLAQAPAGAAGWAARRAPLELRFWRDPARRSQFVAAAWAQLRALGVLMAIAFVLESLMLAYVPAGVIAAWLGGSGVWAIPGAVALGVPAYLNGVAAVPLIGGLIEQGMNPAVGLAFMVAGGITSVPATLAVWALVKPRVFALYIGLAATGALAAGYAYAAWLAFALSAAVPAAT
jgi:uncharacterized membrane protein YraQ (UPF0718 family)